MPKLRRKFIIEQLPNQVTGIFADTNGDGVVNADDRVSLGNPQPKIFSEALVLTLLTKPGISTCISMALTEIKTLNYIESNLESFQKRGSEGVEM